MSKSKESVQSTAAAQTANEVEVNGIADAEVSNPTKAELLKQLLAEVTPEEMQEVGAVIRDKQKLVAKAVAEAEAKALAAQAEAEARRLAQEHEIELFEFIGKLATELALFNGKVRPVAPGDDERWTSKSFKTWMTEQLKGLPAMKGRGKKRASGKRNKKGNGVIDHIEAAIRGAGQAGITKVEILEKLVAQFPERDKDSMKVTINAQVPTRLNSSRGMNIQNIDGVYVNMQFETEAEVEAETAS